MAASFTDLMASLMVIFILLFVAYSNNVSSSRGSATDSVLEALKKGLAEARDASRVERDPRDRYAIVVIMPDSLLFERGRFDVLPEGKRYLERFAPVFAKILCSQQRGLIETVVVQGHTDTTYVGGATGDSIPLPERGRAFNLKLSQERSLAVVMTCLESLRGSPNRPTFLRLLSASGRGQEELLPGYPYDAPQQRRVAFKVRVQVDSLSDIVNKLPPESAVVTTPR
jgi:outer membrane protein OmpA-like peptidoglycan-associated protein